MEGKKFLKGDWLKRVVFQPNLKYLHAGISFPWQPTRWCFDFENMAERFPEWVWMLFTWIPSQCPHFAVKSSPYPSGFGCITYCLARENGQWVIKTAQPHSWMKMALCEQTHAYVCVNCQILTGGNKKIWMVSCIFHFCSSSSYKCCLIINF